ncbi:MAG: folate family ECF transporter S component [Clostridia bacterium]|nr:folate family ECF transporter S component [Clostridia bacterium]
MSKNQQRLLQTVFAAMMAALCMVLDRFGSFHVINLKIGLAFVPVVLVAVLCGPIHAALTWGIADLVGALCFPFGPYHPGFTVVAVAGGLLYGLFLRCEKLTWWRVAIPALFNCLLGLFLNTLWISQLYTTNTYWGFFVGRLATEYAILLPLNLILIPVIYRLGRLLRRRMNA